MIAVLPFLRIPADEIVEYLDGIINEPLLQIDTPIPQGKGTFSDYVSPALRAANATRIASLNTPVPGDPKGRNFDARSFGTALIDGDTIVFAGAAGR
jgi:hypothetical protein